MPQKAIIVRWLAPLLSLALLAAACSGEDPLGDELSADGTAATATTTAVEVPAEGDDSSDEDATDAEAPEAESTDADPDSPSDDAASTTALATPPELVGEGLAPLAPQPADVPFPTDSWPDADLGDSLDADDADAVEVVVEAAFDDSEPTYGSIQAIVVVSGGEIVAERYGRGYDPEETHVSWSVAKSITHAMLGILSGEGRIDILAPAPVGEWSATNDPRQVITPDMLARMSSGLSWNEVFDAVKLIGQAPGAEIASIQAMRPLDGEPNTVFNYSTGSIAINARIIGDEVGTGDEFGAWADTELFAPIGVRSVELEFDQAGYFAGGYGANMTARDFARFGLLYARDGVWDGERILPEGWVDYARTPSSTSNGYGSGFWLSDDGFNAAGFLGQRVAIVPEKDLVIVVLANEFNDKPIGRLLDDLAEPFAEFAR